MRCKKHLMDHSSTVGVCSTCLRERLIAIIAAQEKAHAQEDGDPARKPETKPPPPLVFPRSVSPYLSHRKSDTATLHHHGYHIRSYHSLPDPKFFSTPQLGPNGTIIVEKKKKSKFGLFSRMFGSRSDKHVTVADSVSKVSESRISGLKVSEARDSSTTSSPAWFPSFLSRRKQTRTFSVDEMAIRRLRRDHRGLSPVMDSDDEVDSEHCRPDPSGYDSDEWRHTPRRTPAVGRRGGAAAGGRSTQLTRNVSGISFCLSPMVRASPSQSWSYKGGMPPDMVVSGEIRWRKSLIPLRRRFARTDRESLLILEGLLITVKL